jgi:hypothetical protein
VTTASVVITNHDYAGYLADAVDSALGQTWADTQVVVVDDGSTDGSRVLLASYGRRIRLLLQPQHGQTAAMNAGFAASDGDVVLFLDADDVLRPSAVESAVAALSCTAAVKVHWPVTVVDASGIELGRTLPVERLPEGDLRDTALRSGPQALPFPPTSGNAWSRTFLSEVFPVPTFESRLRVGSASADALLSMLALFAGRVVALAQPLTEYRVHGGNDYAGSSPSTRVDRHVAVTELQYAVVEDFCRDHGYAVDAGAWRRTSYFHRLAAARDHVERAMPAGGTALLLDAGEWEPGLVRDRLLRTFPERSESWWGYPADDRSAVEELRRALRSGVGHVIVAWQCSWWLDVYPGMAAELRQRSAGVDATPDVTVFRLGGAGQ